MPRFALYSHDTFGLGHFRRCLKLARALKREFPGAEGLFLTGSPWADRFNLPSGFTTQPLPAVVKRGPGTYVSRDPRRSLADVLTLRRKTILEALRRFCPDLLVVDNVPCGLHGEMIPALSSETGARKILALRDVLDDPIDISREWLLAGAERALRDHYDEVWLFGEEEDLQRLVTDEILGFLTEKTVACGRLETGLASMAQDAAVTRTDPLVVATGGGGGDARDLVFAYLRGIELYRPKVRSRLVLGPDFPRSSLPSVPDSVEVVAFDPEFDRSIARADVTVSMAGYNTICEILEVGTRAVVVPRVTPRREQLLRTERLAARGRVTMIHPRELTPEVLWRAVLTALRGVAPRREALEGGSVAACRARSLLSVPAVAGAV